MTSLWSLLFILSVTGINQLADFANSQLKPYKNSTNWSSGGPTSNLESEAGLFLRSAIYSTGEDMFPNEISDLVILPDASVVGLSYPLTNLIPTRNGLKKYKVRTGDTLSSIAASFGISLETIRLANPGVRSSIKISQELIVLPVSGILYEIKDGDSLEIVANRYGVDPFLIRQYNPNYQRFFEKAGETVILPHAKFLGGIEYVNRYVRGLPDLKTYFALPARGWNWGQLHEFNAVDIADQCGKPIYASAEGLVVEESSGDYWNQGYGNFVLVEHPNGTRTKYAHNSKNLARVGDYVSQGDEIALIGSSGNTHGPTGCHLHFEVLGARNPFAIR